NLIIANAGSHDVLRFTLSSATLTTIAGIAATQGFGGDGQSATSATLNAPAGVAVDLLGDLFIADTGNNRIRKVTPDGIINTVAGTGVAGFGGDGGQATAATLSAPSGLAIDRNGNLL